MSARRGLMDDRMWSSGRGARQRRERAERESARFGEHIGGLHLIGPVVIEVRALLVGHGLVHVGMQLGLAAHGEAHGLGGGEDHPLLHPGQVPSNVSCSQSRLAHATRVEAAEV